MTALSVIAEQIKVVNEQIDAKQRGRIISHYTLSGLTIKQLKTVRVFLLSFHITEEQALRAYEDEVCASVKRLRALRDIELDKANTPREQSIPDLPVVIDCEGGKP